MGEQEVDPYDAETPFTYECTGCGQRLVADAQPDVCPECGDAMRDISIPQE